MCLSCVRNLTAPIRLSPYGISKLAGEKYLAYYAFVYGVFDMSHSGLATCMGHDRIQKVKPGVIAIFSEQMLKGGQPIINGTGMQTRDFVYVEDVVDSIMVTLPPDVQGIYNVGTGQETSVNDCYKILKDLTGSECKDLHGPAKKGEQLRSVLDVTKLRKEFGWDPTYFSSPMASRRLWSSFKSQKR